VTRISRLCSNSACFSHRKEAGRFGCLRLEELIIWNLLKRAPDRVVAAVPAQPVGFRPEMPTLLYDGSMTGWGPELVKRRPDITMDMVEKYLTRMYRTNPDFVFTVTRDFVRNCQTPVLILPDDVPAHPYAVTMECAMLAPKADVSMYPWKEPKERIPLAVRQIRSFLRAHRPASRRRCLYDRAAGGKCRACPCARLGCGLRPWGLSRAV